ncbi:rhombosortase [Ningiella sp. W23]|uniref:rhombosortase n=1 Tax=Ningiella sp. W23 TaxID=3023715 RepID=UPI003756575C
MGNLTKKLITKSGACVLIVCVCLIFALLALLDPIGELTYSLDAFALTQSALNKQEYWRLFTAHFVHSNVAHLGLNIAGCILTWALFYEYLSTKRLALLLPVCTLGLSLILLMVAPTIWYVGLSGTLHGVFAFALCFDIKTKRMTTYLLVLIGVAKLIYEQLGGSTEDTANLIGVAVAVDGHLYGAVLGVLSAAIVMLLEKRT